MFLTRFVYGIAYVAVLIMEISKGTFDTAKRALKGGETIDPVVVDIKTELTRPIAQTILANSITLTPGSVSVDLNTEKQLIKVAIISPRDPKKLIPFEPYIKKMLE
ncbi:MAG: Na+/H+ antiporter subunit E [Methanobrevibacter sp.]|nr:Na+/H+ antiporter subunit E [Methanobrevibacter sp.]